MGVKNLWDILDSCKKKLPLHHLQNKKVCVDLSCWLVQLHTAHRSSAFTKDKVYLKNLFHRIRALLALNCSLVFVTDGAIPAVKLATYRRRLGANPNADAARDSQPSSTSLRRNMGSEFSCMIKEAKRLGLALGIPCLDGVEEAEAQCALLDFASLCDGCFTSDSDAFLFGARTVYRDVFIGEGGYVICYEMEDIEKKLGFGRNSLISLAVLLGSDYSNGVHGFGPETACRLVKSVGDDSILDQILSDGVKATRKCKAKNIGNKADDILPKTSTCEVGMTQDSDGQFCDVINAYLKPKCHPPDSEAVRRVCCQHPFRRPELQKVCEEYFEWDPEKTDQYILPKIAERELRRFSNLRSASSALGLKPMFSNIPVPCPVSAIVKQRKLHGSVCYEVSWRNIDGLQVSVVPGELVNSACPEKINEFFEKKDGEKKQKRRGRPKKSSAQDAVKDVDSRLQELLLGIESESSTFPHTTSGPHSAYAPSVAPGEDIVDLSSPSPPLRACKIAKSQRFSGSTTGATNGIDLQCQSLLTGMMESQSSTQSSGAENSTQDDNLIDLCSPLHPVVGKPRSNKTERRALADISNFPEKGGLLRDSASLDKVEAAASGRHLESSPSVSHETESSGIITNCSWRSGDSGNAIDLSSPSPVVGDTRVRVFKHDDPDVIDICDGESEHERKARDLRSFLDSIRNELL